MTNSYPNGQQVKVIDTITQSGVDVDPSTVTCKVKDPSGTVSTYTYSGGDITRESTGVYSYVVDANADGKWHYRFQATGNGAGAGENSFLVFSDFQ
jgi:hypothetical protein